MPENKISRSERTAHLEEKVNALVDLVDAGYGMALVEQLMGRFEATANQFVAQAEGLLDRLRQNAATQEELLDRIRQSDTAKTGGGPLPQEIPEEEITEWEKRLARLEESGE